METTRLGRRFLGAALLTMGFCLANAANTAAAETVPAGGKLPAPRKTGGESVLEAIDRRASAGQDARDYAGTLDAEELATVLRAATGHNRDGKKWAVPMAMGKPPYVKVFVAAENGVFRYDWKEHSLVKVSADDHRAKLGMQDFAKAARYQLIIALDGDELAAFPAERRDEFGLVLVGAASQNVYLAAAAVGAGTRYIASVERGADAKKALALAENDRIVCLMTLGKKQ